jgi:ABC-type antimicrobial peptide transport system permease subunit
MAVVKPPKLATQLLRWYCRPELLEDLEGDLHEYFERNVTSKGVTRAKCIYFIDVLKFLRLYTVRKPNPNAQLLQWIMIQNYIKISGRILLRNRLFSTINIVGLGVSMAVGLLLISLLYDMSQYDKFHVNNGRIYRVINKYKFLEHEDESFYASTSLRAGKAIEETVPGIEKIVVLQRGFEGDMKATEKVVPLVGLWANEDFFSVFSFELISGDPATALKDPYSIVLTETASTKLFGSTAVLGKGIIYPHDKNKKEYIITGVVKDVPSFSHLRFDMLASLSTREITEKDNKHVMAWSNMWDTYVYLLLPQAADINTLQHNLNVLAENENKKDENVNIQLSLQPLGDIALGIDTNNSIGPVMLKSNVWMIGVLTVVVILSACFNYTNLSVARALRRSKEVGIRKVVGALKAHVVGQFLVEAIMISLFALVFSFGLFALLKPHFLALDDLYKRMLTLEISPMVVVYFVLLAIVVGFFAGVLPALFFARVNAVHILKNIATVRVFKNLTMRKALIVVQFTISLMFIAVTIIGYKHYKNILAFDLGFKTDNIVNIRLYGNKADLLKKELLTIPEIQQISTSLMITSIGNTWMTTMKYNNPHDSTGVNYNVIDENYIPLHGHKLLAGRNFLVKSEGTPETEVIVNEKVLKRFNIGAGDPSKAIGEIVTVNKEQLKIIGVLKDFYYGRSTDKKQREVVFRYVPGKFEYINAKIVSTDWPNMFSKIEGAWKKIDDVHPLEATFYDEQIARAYGDLSSRLKTVGALALLAICIAAIGLLGMVVFTTETRLKEISIRKVLGASESSLVVLLSKNFVLLLAIATLIAFPATQFFFMEYILDHYADGAPVAWTELLIGLIAVVTIALSMIGTHTLKVARTNPAEVLKTE